MQMPLPLGREPTDLSDIDWEDQITLEQASQMSGLSVATLKLYAERGMLKAVKLESKRDWLTTPLWLQEYLDNRIYHPRGRRGRKRQDRMEH